MINNLPELLAPANLNTLEAAVTHGADAVYLGGDMFSARKSAKNFSLSELESAIDYCHLNNVKVYLTVNTLIADIEFHKFYDFVYNAASIGVDSFIVQDIGVMSVLKNLIPEVPLHASTQMTIHNLEGARLAKDFGFKRVVLSRELSKENVSLITSSSGIETEVFVHGALCVSYSGQCLLSSLIGGRSGNRGACAQPCRLPYKLYKDDELATSGYLLNTKDLSIAKNIPELIQMGVSSLKIEGRMKDENYVSTCVSVFRKCLDTNTAANDDDISMLENAFSRGGFTKGFYEKSSLTSMMRTNHGNNDVFDKKVFLKTYDEVLKKLPVDIEVSAIAGKKLIGTITNDNFSFKYVGDIVSEAKNKPTDKKTILRQVTKLGDTPFETRNVDIVAGENIFLPLSAVNELRRCLARDLEKAIINSYKRSIPRFDLPEIKTVYKKPASYTAQIETIEQYNAICSEDFKYIFIPVHLFENISHTEKNVYVFPDIIQDSQMEYFSTLLDKLKAIDNCAVLTGNYAIISKAKRYNLKIFGSSALNIFNSYSLMFWQQFGLCGGVLSNELRLDEISALTDSSFEKIINIYGHITAMQTAYCPVSVNIGKCDCHNGKYIMKDRKNEKFAILKSDMSSACRILNSKPVYMADRLDEVSGCDCLNFLFTTEIADECIDVLKAYQSKLPCNKPFTRGHFYRGII